MSDDELGDGPDPRAETDVVQFGDDWPGIFIRGDNALYFALALGQMVDAMPTEGNPAIINKAVLDGLRATLASCDVSLKPDIVKLRPFAECLAPEPPLHVGTGSPTKRVPSHPGQILRDEFLVPGRMTRQRVAEEMHRYVEYVDLVIEGKQRIDAYDAIRLANTFGTTPQFWMNLQTAWDIWMAGQVVPGERRAPVPAVSFPRPRPAGTVAWSEHLAAWDGLKARRGSVAAGRDAEAVAAEGGFTYEELVEYLGYAPKTWLPA